MSQQRTLDLKAGEWVEIRSQEEILATLDAQGRLDNLPFMPEMLQHCGRRFQVFKRADKTCDYIQNWSIRRIENTVHLAGLRCDGSGHGGCEASCLIFWKEAWLKRADNNVVSEQTLRPAIPQAQRGGFCSVATILAASQREDETGASVYSCQATDVPKFTAPMRVWDLRQYVRDLRSGNLASGLATDTRAQRALETVLGILQVLRAIVISVFNEVQARRHGHAYPHIAGTATTKSQESLHLQPGELVQVRSSEEIAATLDKNQRSRGLWFDSEMLPYCGGIYRVLRRVNRIIDEKTGKMISMKSPCIVLEGVVCRADYHRLCPRSIYPYWRESWLRRASSDKLADTDAQAVEACHGS